VVPTVPARIYTYGTLRLLSRSTDGGQTWEFVELPATCDARSLVVSALRPQVMFLAGGCGLRRSDDGGTSWDVVFDYYAMDVAVSPADPRIMYAGSSTFNYASNPRARDGFWRSDDGGTTWMAVHSDVPANRLRFDLRDANSNTLVVRSGRQYYRTADGGITWAAFDGPPLGERMDTNDHLIVQGRLLVATGAGLWAMALPPSQS
jgi:photosystem II stability/assembly factor-like uncharacterized protein